MTSTRCPARFSCCATASPAGPDPMTQTRRPVRCRGGWGLIQPFRRNKHSIGHSVKSKRTTPMVRLFICVSGVLCDCLVLFCISIYVGPLSGAFSKTAETGDCPQCHCHTITVSNSCLHDCLNNAASIHCNTIVAIVPLCRWHLLTVHCHCVNTTSHHCFDSTSQLYTATMYCFNSAHRHNITVSAPANCMFACVCESLSDCVFVCMCVWVLVEPMSMLKLFKEVRNKQRVSGKICCV